MSLSTLTLDFCLNYVTIADSSNIHVYLLSNSSVNKFTPNSRHAFFLIPHPTALVNTGLYIIYYLE